MKPKPLVTPRPSSQQDWISAGYRVSRNGFAYLRTDDPAR